LKGGGIEERGCRLVCLVIRIWTNMKQFRLILLLGVSLLIGAASPSTQPTGGTFSAISDPSLPNAHRLTANVICGGLPDGEAGFAALQSLGVKTVISVDGLMPDVELAHAHGMRYVHLPIGYDKVPVEQGETIAKAVAELPGPVYIHCHHGQHRGPAAAAVACVHDGLLTPEQAESALREVGTGKEYKGLWQSVREARPIDPKVPRGLPEHFVERAQVPPLAEAMVTTDQIMDRLNLLQKSGWRTPADHPDLDPPHEALQLKEMFAEIARSKPAGQKPPEFGARLQDAATAAENLRLVLASNSHDQAAADNALTQVGRSCTACHVAFRN
jgi:hypothetical protein